MKLINSSVVEYQLESNFSHVRQRLLEEQFADRWNKQLAHWALPSDRRLPLALMGYTIREILDTPFEELYATPGIGQKKIHSLVVLLNRAANDRNPVTADPAPLPDDEGTPSVDVPRADDEQIDPAYVSESVWAEWRKTVESHGLGDEKLGRFAVSLQNLPRVLWDTPLRTYTGLTLAEIRKLKTHGEKRVRVILETFGALHQVLTPQARATHLEGRLLPREIRSVEDWLLRTLPNEGLPDADDILVSFIRPLLEQVRIDAGAQIADLGESRLGLSSTGRSVRQTAARLGLTRARVYQLLADIGAILDVRWPEGHYLVNHLRDRIARETRRQPASEPFFLAADLFFPSRRNGQIMEEEDESEDQPVSLRVSSHRHAG
ncbi:MAG: hypothetical protein HY000_19500 [Planctomycetes bacterium]|nr:hypothetical protein [Planctomycetota bacterium]